MINENPKFAFCISEILPTLSNSFFVRAKSPAKEPYPKYISSKKKYFDIGTLLNNCKEYGTLLNLYCMKLEPYS